MPLTSAFCLLLPTARTVTELVMRSVLLSPTDAVTVPVVSATLLLAVTPIRLPEEARA
jgi:hypothetical protein